MKGSLLLVSLWLSALAFAAPGFFGEKGDGYRPRCLTNPASRTHLFFTWKESEKTERKIWARVRRLSCGQWRSAGSWLAVHSWTEVAPNQDVVLGYRLDAATREALRQVRYGASELRAEPKAADWIRAHPIGKYTHEVNVALTQRFGMGFSGDVYQAWIELRPENHSVRDRYRYWFNEVRKDASRTDSLRQRMKGRKVLISLGMGWDPKSASVGSEVDTFAREIGAMGADVTILKNYPFDDIQSNVGILWEQLNGELNKGSDVILIGMCKGSVELMAAYSLATRQYLDAQKSQNSRAPGRGRVVAYLNLSGMIGGTFLGDVLNRVPFHETISAYLHDDFKGTKHEIGQALLQLETMGTAEIRKFTASTWGKGVPADTVYFNVVGVPPESGIAPYETGLLKSLRAGIRRYQLSNAASDAYIEYPLNELPAGLGKTQYTLVLPGSHMLWDGVYQGEVMSKTENRQALTMAMFHTLLDVIPD